VKFELFHFHLFYDENATGWSDNDRGGETQTFGHDILDKFLTDNNLKMVVRAHQTCQNGFNMRQDQKLVTVFSAPNYCQRDGNDGAVMVIESDGSYDFEILKPVYENFEFEMSQFVMHDVSNDKVQSNMNFTVIDEDSGQNSMDSIQNSTENSSFQPMDTTWTEYDENSINFENCENISLPTSENQEILDGLDDKTSTKVGMMSDEEFEEEIEFELKDFETKNIEDLSQTSKCIKSIDDDSEKQDTEFLNSETKTSKFHSETQDERKTRRKVIEGIFSSSDEDEETSEFERKKKRARQILRNLKEN